MRWFKAFLLNHLFFMIYACFEKIIYSKELIIVWKIIKENSIIKMVFLVN